MFVIQVLGSFLLVRNREGLLPSDKRKVKVRDFVKKWLASSS